MHAAPALQDIACLQDCARLLCTLLDDMPASFASVLAGSSLPRAALELAARLECTGNLEAAEQVGERGFLCVLMPYNVSEAFALIAFHVCSFPLHACRLRHCDAAFPPTCRH